MDRHDGCGGKRRTVERPLINGKRHHPDVSLLDLRMPVLDGVGAINEIRKQDGAARIIVLTTYDGDEDIYQGISAGAKAYLFEGRSAR